MPPACRCHQCEHWWLPFLLDSRTLLQRTRTPDGVSLFFISNPYRREGIYPFQNAPYFKLPSSNLVGAAIPPPGHFSIRKMPCRRHNANYFPSENPKNILFFGGRRIAAPTVLSTSAPSIPSPGVLQSAANLLIQCLPVAGTPLKYEGGPQGRERNSGENVR